jgi:hypothetical protein
LPPTRDFTEHLVNTVWDGAFASMPELLALSAMLAMTLATTVATIAMWWLTTRFYFRRAFGIPNADAVKVYARRRGRRVQVAAFQYPWQAEAFIDELNAMKVARLEMPHFLGELESISLARCSE